MPIINTATLSAASRLDLSTNQQVYCGLDSCITLEVFDKIHLDHPVDPAIYSFERALQGPYMEIMQRGIAVDKLARFKATGELHEQMDRARAILDEFAGAIWDRPLNPRSPKQLKEFFYDKLKIPEKWISIKGERKLSLNREVLEKLSDEYLFARPFVSLILTYREMAKQLELFETEIDRDGRFRASYNIAGTETGRPSSSENAFGTGGNAQNIAPGLRYIFCSDPGYRMCVIDLEQVEARDVGFFCGCLFGDWTFLDNCESGDLHTNNAKLIWPERPWTGNPKEDKEIAEQIFYREFSFRDMAKRGGHLSNYYGTAWTAARSLKVPSQIMEDFQARYIRGDASRGIVPAYPAIARWWQWTAEQLETVGHITTPFGRKRHFFGRPNDDTTLREAIAFLPQSTTADRMNLGLWKVWHAMPQIQLLAQTYDSITFQYPESLDENSIIEEALALLKVELVSPSGRKYSVPGEAKVGWNWGRQVTPADQERARAAGKRVPRLNPDGLIKWSRSKPDARSRLVGLARIA
ncbi:DNA polymerase [Patescibacteria group bacterium]|jgi:DNA polymerase I-like protein with 3'-5' exonuclease and polymerase domains|nr:DNA polymerase [Patescibacteria group bacterium]